MIEYASGSIYEWFKLIGWYIMDPNTTCLIIKFAILDSLDDMRVCELNLAFMDGDGNGVFRSA